MIRPIVSLVAFLIVLIAVGCASSPVAGTWKLVIPDDLKPMITALGVTDAHGEAIFEGNGTFTSSFTMTKKGETQTQNSSGTYKLEGKELNVYPSEINGKRVGAEAAVTLTLSDDMKSFTHPDVMGLKFVKQ